MTKTAAGSSQIPLFDDLSEKVPFPDYGIKAEQLGLPESEPLQLCFALMLPKGLVNQGVITEADLERHLLLIKAAAVSPGRTKREVLKLFQKYGDDRPEVLTVFLKGYLRKQLKMKLPEHWPVPAPGVVDEHAPQLTRWSVFHNH